MINSLFVLIGTFIGAGFASGKEVFNFFSIFNLYSFLGIALFSLLTFLVIFKVLQLKNQYNMSTYCDVLDYYDKKYQYFNPKIFLFLVNLFLVISFYIMVCALCTLFYDKFFISKLLTVLIVSLICYIVFSKNDIHFIYSLNLLLIPVIIIFIILLGIKNISFNNLYLDVGSFPFACILKCLFYFSYNSLLIIPILFQLDIPKNKILIFSLAFSFIIFILMSILNLILLINFNLICAKELPILHISNLNGNVYSLLYFFIFLSAIITTLISSGFAFCNNLINNKKLKIVVFLLVSFIFSVISFSSLINFFYTVLGLIGFIQIFLILLSYNN